MKKKVVVALGHRALGTTLPDQKTQVMKTTKILADLIEDDYQLVISHSNGPQVGMIHTAMNEFAKNHPGYTDAPMSVCSAMSQGYIGYDIQNALTSELLSRSIYKSVATVLTQVIVDPYDEAFYHPTKVIGRYLTSKEAELEEKKGNYVIEDSEHGYRRIIGSPKPQSIVEIAAIKALCDAEQIVIAGGGGGIPVLRQGTVFKGASGVIEKDLTAGLLARQLDADVLMILTNDEKVAIHYHTDDQMLLSQVTVEEAKTYIANGEFGKLKMEPKIQAAVDFVSEKPGRIAIITCADHALAALHGETGTIIS